MATPSSAEPWELAEQLARLQEYDPVEVVGRSRMGAGMQFVNAGNEVKEVASLLDDLRPDWDRVGRERKAQIAGHANALISVVDASLKMDSTKVDTTAEGETWAPDVLRAQRDANEESIGNEYAWFLDYVAPLCVTAPARRAVDAHLRDQAANLSDARIQELEQKFAELTGLAVEFEEMRPTVEAQRELLGRSGTVTLSGEFLEEATSHETAWRRWFVALLVSVLIAGVGGVAFILATKPPTEATNAQIASHLFLDLLVIGLALFIVRTLSLQFRAHRHMEVIARGKASALSTFNRLVEGQTDEVKTVVASALAQAVFKIDEDVFSDASAEHVTILERVLSPGIDRAR